MFDFFVSAIDKQMFVYYNQGTKRTNVRKKCTVSTKDVSKRIVFYLLIQKRGI